MVIHANAFYYMDIILRTYFMSVVRTQFTITGNRCIVVHGKVPSRKQIYSTEINILYNTIQSQVLFRQQYLFRLESRENKDLRLREFLAVLVPFDQYTLQTH